MCYALLNLSFCNNKLEQLIDAYNPDRHNSSAAVTCGCVLRMISQWYYSMLSG